MKDISFPKDHFQLIAMGASTGGTEALLAVLERLPATLPPIVITQHMPAVFTKMYADRLNKICKMEVREAADGDKLYPGLCLIAPGGHCPSIDYLFHSVAEVYGEHALGILLTGMGRDGAEGLLSMHEKGAYTLGQDKESSVVYGMPMEAFKLGAVDRQGNLEEIADYLLCAVQ